MLTFYRRIRKTLIDSGRLSRYFIYAIGEILLVVIGILIALQINNWNENRKNLSKKEILLKSLRIEFTSNLTQLDTVLSYDNLVLKSTKRLMKLYPENSIEMASDSMPIWLQNSSFRWTFNPATGVLRSGISSGEIHLIKSDVLVDLLFKWPDFVADAREDEDRCVASVIASRSIVEKHVRNVDYRHTYKPELGKSKFPSDYQSLLRDPLFEDFLGERYLSMDDALKALNEVKKQNILILKLIDMELNKS